MPDSEELLCLVLIVRTAKQPHVFWRRRSTIRMRPDVIEFELSSLRATNTTRAHEGPSAATACRWAHARYSRVEILAAFGVGVAGEDRAGGGRSDARRSPGARVAPWQMGVYWADDERADLLAFTLDKTSGAFSPTTRYREYAVSRDLIHWESQNMVRADSATGRRYQRHAAEGSSVLLFTRLRDDDRAF